MGKRKSSIQSRGFQKGHSYYVPFSKNESVNEKEGVWIPRLTQKDFSKIAKVSSSGLLDVPDGEGVSGSSKLLRPMATKEDIWSEVLDETDDGKGEMRFIHKERQVNMWNECIRDHTENFSQCRVPEFQIVKEVQKGLCWKQALGCTKCHYVSKTYKLYDEVMSDRRGAKSAAPNLGLQVGLQESTTGNAKARVIIASTNMPPPSRSGMQLSSNKVGNITASLVSEDLKQKRQGMKDTNKLRGLPETTPVNISMDARYNSNTIVSRGKMGQNASQAIAVAIECQTNDHQIVSMQMENKLCWVGSWLRNRGYDVKCPGGHIQCTATLAVPDPISEYTLGEKIGNDFVEEDLLIKYAVTDGDSHSSEGLQAAMRTLDPLWKVERQADTTHLAQGQFRHTLKADFSVEMFPGENAETRREQRKLFGLDIKNRCHLICKEMQEMYGGNFKKMAERMPKVLQATVECYSGNCNMCRKHGIVCRGGKLYNWWRRSIYLSRDSSLYGFSHLNTTLEDCQLLREILRLRLGTQALELTKFGYTTNKNEAVNRSISASLPKNVNFSRNSRARAFAAVDRVNYGAGLSMARKLKAVGMVVSQKGGVCKALRQIQRDSKYYSIYKRNVKVKSQLLSKKAQAIKQYYKGKANRKKQMENKSVYRKGLQNPMLHKMVKGRRKDSNAIKICAREHSYASSTPIITRAYARHRQNDHTYMARNKR